MLVTSNEKFLPPFPDNLIVNEGVGAKIPIVKGKTYRLRFISFAAFASVMVEIDSHNLDVIMNDATYVKKDKATQLRIAPAQRYDVLVQANGKDQNYPILFSLDMNRDWKNDPPAQIVWPHNVTGQLVQDPNGPFTELSVASWTPVEDSQFSPFDDMAVLEPVSQRVVLNFAFCRDVNNLPRYASFLTFPHSRPVTNLLLNVPQRLL